MFPINNKSLISNVIEQKFNISDIFQDPQTLNTLKEGEIPASWKNDFTNNRLETSIEFYILLSAFSGIFLFIIFKVYFHFLRIVNKYEKNLNSMLTRYRINENISGDLIGAYWEGFEAFKDSMNLRSGYSEEFNSGTEDSLFPPEQFEMHNLYNWQGMDYPSVDPISDSYSTLFNNRAVRHRRKFNIPIFYSSMLRSDLRNLDKGKKSESDKFGITVVSPKNEFMKRLVNVIEEHISEENFGIESLGKCLSVSRGTLYKKVKLLTGRSPSSFLSSYRLNRARHLLIENNTTVAEAAYSVGFGSPAYFTKCFRKEFGYTPGKLLIKTRISA